MKESSDTVGYLFDRKIIRSISDKFDSTKKRYSPPEQICELFEKKDFIFGSETPSIDGLQSCDNDIIDRSGLWFLFYRFLRIWHAKANKIKYACIWTVRS